VDSSERSSLKEGLTPFWAIMQADLESLFKSKITIGWLLAGVFLSLMRVLTATFLGTTSRIIAQGLSDFIYIWSMLIIGLTASAVASESGEFADSIMSKSIKRYDYILAKFSSRICYVTAMYSLITTVLIGASVKMLKNDYEIYGLVASFLFVALAIVMLTTIGVTFSTMIPNTVISIVVLLVLWYSMTFFFPLLDPLLNLISPSNLASQLPNIIRGIWNGEEWQIAAGFAAISIASTSSSTLYFSKKDL